MDKSALISKDLSCSALSLREAHVNNGLPPEEVIFGHSLAMQAIRQRVEKLAGANVPVLIQGESGTGKDLIARLIQLHSPWASGPLVKVN